MWHSTTADGKSVYDTYVTLDGTYHVTVTLDLNHPEIRRMIAKATRAVKSRSIEAGGALKVEVE